MEERERQVLIEKTCTNNIPPQSNNSTNGAEHVNGKAGITVDSFAGIASKIIGSNMKGQVTSKLADRTTKQLVKHTGALDDLPLGSEAHSLSSEYNTVTSYPLLEDKRPKWMKAESQAIVGWQSFNSDVSNHTSASSASLEQLLNDRQVDPEEMLLSLGFGGEGQSLLPSLSRVPNRFLSHPSRAYGIVPPPPGQCSSENVDSEAQDDVPATQQDETRTTAASAAAAHSAPKRRTGMWTLARTLSILRPKAAVAAPSSRGHVSPSSNSGSAAQPASILHPANQRYLASKGYYQKQGWPKGSFAEAEEGPCLSVSREGQDAACKRKMFHKSRSRPNWSMCDSGEDNSTTGDWVTKSVDGLRSRDHAQDDSLAGLRSRDHAQDDSLTRGTYFSTTTESSTDSLDTPNLEIARAFEDIRRDFLASTQAERSSSEELFLPCQDSTDSSIQQQLLNIQPAAGHNYFVSPASSRQATVEKAATISDQSYAVHLTDTSENFISSTDQQQQSPQCLLLVDAGAQAAFSDSGSSSTVTGLALAVDEDVSEAGMQRSSSQHTCSSSQTTDADFHIAHMLNINQTHSKKPGFVSKVQLSTLPANISHLELMKRLQHSQNELPRMGSVQSDSSGFGDADPALESAADNHKMKMSRTDGCSAQAPQYGAVSERYVTMCYIPTLSSRAHQSTHNPTLKATGSTNLTASRCRPRAGSEPRVRVGSDQKHGAGSHLRNIANSDVRHVANSDVRHVADSDVRHLANSELKRADYVHPKSTPVPNSEAEAGVRMSPHVQHVRLQQAATVADPHIRDVRGKIFTSQIDLYANTSGFSRQYVDKLRRHSDEGILDCRNDKPLSVELAQANPPPSPATTVRQSSSSIPPQISTAAASAYSVATFDNYKTHAGIHYHPPLAGNIRGLATTSVRRHILASTTRQKSCDILDDDCVSISTPTNITSCHDMDASSYSSMAESSSDFSSVSMAELQQQHEYTHMSVLDSRKLARLINQPIYFKGKKRCASQYRPRHLFKEWNLLSKRKRLQEENQLLQNAVHKYKTELSILEASFFLDYQTVYADTTHDYREEVEELECLWSEVKVQVMELEQLMMNRIRSVHAGNDLYSFMSNMGVIERMVELIKEQVFQQQLSTSRMWGGGDDEEEAAGMFDAAGHLLHSWLLQEGVRRGSLPAPAAANISIEQVKSSVLSQIKTELEASTTKLQHDLQENEREIKRLQEQLNRSDPNVGSRWTRKSPSVKSATRLHKSATRLHSRVATTSHVTQETDV